MNQKPMQAVFQRSKRKDKKYQMQFLDKDKDVIKTIDFGQKGASDYTIHQNEDRRDRYLKRHSKDPHDPLTAGQLSRMLLWGKTPNLKKQLKEYQTKYDIKVIDKT